MDGDIAAFAQVMVVIVASCASFLVLGLGAAALYRRISAPSNSLTALPRDENRMQRLETAVDAIAIEVERISESQRFMVGLLAESLPARRADAAGELPAPGRGAGRVNTPH